MDMTAATPQNQDYTLGSGEVWFANFVAGTKTPAGFRYFGNTPAFSFGTTTTTLDHVDSDHGHPKFVDRTLPLTVVEELSLTCDNISWDNVAMSVLGTKSTVTTTSATVAAEHIDDVSPGLHYQLGQTTNNPSGVRGLDTVSTGIYATVTDDAGTPVSFAQTTDFIVDPDRGTIYIVEGGAIVEGTNLRVTYKTRAASHTRVISGQNLVEGALKFVSFNSQGTQKDYFFPYVQITPDGEFGLKGDTWQELKFKMKTLKLVGKASVYVDGTDFI
jgi:hypothetical protein